MIDLHSHVLAGIDDGPRDLDGSAAIARAAVAAGIETLVATPHVSARYPNDAATIAAAFGEARARIAAEELPLELVAGAEVAVTETAQLGNEQLRALRLGSGPWLLIEPPFTQAGVGLQGLVEDLLGAGHRVVLAHPERCPVFQREPRMLATLVAEGVLTSITAGSLIGRFGGEARGFALQLLERGLAHNVASDAHDHRRRAPGMSAAIERAGYASLSEWLTYEVPRAILAGEQVPPRPARASRARGLRRALRVRR